MNRLKIDKQLLQPYFVYFYDLRLYNSFFIAKCFIFIIKWMFVLEIADVESKQSSGRRRQRLAAPIQTDKEEKKAIFKIQIDSVLGTFVNIYFNNIN